MSDEETELNRLRRSLRERVMAWVESSTNGLDKPEAIAVWAVLEIDATLQTIADHLHDIERNTRDTRI